MPRKEPLTRAAVGRYNAATVMAMLDLELVGGVRQISADEIIPAGAAPTVAKMRASHHALARLLARGAKVQEASLMTGYSPATIASLQADQTFKNLVTFYRENHDNGEALLEGRLRLIAEDYLDELHQRVLDRGEEIATADLRENAKFLLDRAGYAPVHRTVNKNLNLNIGERLDAARRRQETDNAA